MNNMLPTSRDSVLPPKGSAITFNQDGDVTNYSWSAKERHPLQWFPLFFGCFMLFGGVGMPIFMYSNPAFPMPMHEALLFGAIALAVGTLFLYSGLTKRGRETLSISPAAIEYDSGPTIFPLFVMWFFAPMLNQIRSAEPIRFSRKKYRMPTTSIGQFTLEQVGERQRLRVDFESDRIEIGVLLREPDREWLANVLCQWQQETDTGVLEN